MNAVGKEKLVIVDGGYWARQGTDRGVFKKGGFCFYCQMYGSILICIRIYKLFFAWGLPVWYVLVVLIQYLDQKANVFILGIPVIIENFPRRRQRPDGNVACVALLALRPQLVLYCFVLPSEHL